MKTILIFAFLLSSTQALALFGPDWYEKTEYCGAIKDTLEKERCLNLWSSLEKDKALPIKKDHFELCGKTFKYIQEVQQVANQKWELANACLRQIAYRRFTEIPKDQLKYCDWLLERGKSVPRYLYCLQEFEPETIKICDYAKEKSNFEYGGKCLKTLYGVKPAPGTSKNFADKCKQMIKNDGRPLQAFTFPDWQQCLENLAEKSESSGTAPSIDFESGAFQSTGR